jgi:hypothetical protein
MTIILDMVHWSVSYIHFGKWKIVKKKNDPKWLETFLPLHLTQETDPVSETLRLKKLKDMDNIQDNSQSSTVNSIVTCHSD